MWFLLNLSMFPTIHYIIKILSNNTHTTMTFIMCTYDMFMCSLFPSSSFLSSATERRHQMAQGEGRSLAEWAEQELRKKDRYTLGSTL